MAETTVIHQPYITDEKGILKVLKSMEKEAFNDPVNVGRTSFNSCSHLLAGDQKPYAKELFEDNPRNQKMWKDILIKLGLSKTHKFEIKQYCLKDGTKQFHEDNTKMMLVFIRPNPPMEVVKYQKKK